MGGTPCYQKVIQDGRLQKAANNVIVESKIADNLLAAKGYYDSPILQTYVEYEQKCINALEEMEAELATLNEEFAKENN